MFMELTTTGNFNYFQQNANQARVAHNQQH